MRTASLVMFIAGAAGAAHAQPIFSAASGSDLAGGTLTIKWLTPAGFVFTSAGIVVGGAAEGMATVPAPGGAGSAGFSVDGDTFIADWSLTNSSTNSQFFICGALFDLTGTFSLFDDDFGGAAAGTPVGLEGVGGVVYLAASTAPMQVIAFESDPWLGGFLPNVGDMYWKEGIEWAGPVFASGETYLWHDDTDLVPAPGPLALIGLAAAVAGRRRRR